MVKTGGMMQEGWCPLPSWTLAGSEGISESSCSRYSWEKIVLSYLLIFCCSAALYKNLSTWKTDSRKGTKKRLSRQGKEHTGSAKTVAHFFPQYYWEDNVDSQNNLNIKDNGIRIPKHFSASASKETVNPIIHWYQKNKWAFITTNNVEEIKLENHFKSVTNGKMDYI